MLYVVSLGSGCHHHSMKSTLAQSTEFELQAFGREPKDSPSFGAAVAIVRGGIAVLGTVADKIVGGVYSISFGGAGLPDGIARLDELRRVVVTKCGGDQLEAAQQNPSQKGWLGCSKSRAPRREAVAGHTGH